VRRIKKFFCKTKRRREVHPPRRNNSNFPIRRKEQRLLEGKKNNEQIDSGRERRVPSHSEEKKKSERKRKHLVDAVSWLQKGEKHVRQQNRKGRTRTLAHRKKKGEFALDTQALAKEKVLQLLT